MRCSSQRSTAFSKQTVDLSIVIVNWNVGRLLQDCLRSLFEKISGISFEVLVVDNGSTEGSVESLRREFIDAKFILAGANIGFARANNLGIQRAQAEFLALLNPDTSLLNNAFGLMVHYLRAHPKVGAVGPKLKNPNGKIQFDAGRHFPTLLTELSQQFFLYRLFPRSRIWGHYNMTWWNHEDTRAVDALCGACMVVRSEVIMQIGLLDEHFFFCSEDLDWCYRIKWAG